MKIAKMQCEICLKKFCIEVGYDSINTVKEIVENCEKCTDDFDLDSVYMLDGSIKPTDLISNFKVV